ncbi:hypothetical protein BBP40_003614 [Aspergillus hancockii]|nr:hypothetical protein BBP40_003614 [Aspergillus hancockii]
MPYYDEDWDCGRPFQNFRSFCEHLYRDILLAAPGQMLVYQNVSESWSKEASEYLLDAFEWKQFERNRFERKQLQRNHVTMGYHYRTKRFIVQKRGS